MREVISIQVGQAGVQVGGCCWELFCNEYGIPRDGMAPKSAIGEGIDCNSFYSERGNGKLVPRSLFIDTESSAIDDIRTGSHRQLYDPEQLLAGHNDCASVYARGHYGDGKQVLEDCLKQVRKLSENCTGLQGFIVHHSMGGGTGAGLGALILERLSVDYSKKLKMSYSIYPDPATSNALVEPYNAILATHKLLDYTDISMLLDNTASYNICTRGLFIQQPSHRNVNHVIAQMVSSTTASLRFDGALNTTLDEFPTNLVPYPRIHFLCACQAPFAPPQAKGIDTLSPAQLTLMAVQDSFSFAQCKLAHGKCMALSLMFRGDIVPKHVCPALCALKQNRDIRFVDWCSTGIKCGINYQPPTNLPDDGIAQRQRSVTGIANSTAINEVLQRVAYKFDRLYAQRSFVHWYLAEGMEEQEFIEAREDLAALALDYEEVSLPTEPEPNSDSSA